MPEIVAEKGKTFYTSLSRTRGLRWSKAQQSRGLFGVKVVGASNVLVNDNGLGQGSFSASVFDVNSMGGVRLSLGIIARTSVCKLLDRMRGDIGGDASQVRVGVVERAHDVAGPELVSQSVVIRLLHH
jgi:hypothetical protein